MEPATKLALDTMDELTNGSGKGAPRGLRDLLDDMPQRVRRSSVEFRRRHLGQVCKAGFHGGRFSRQHVHSDRHDDGSGLGQHLVRRAARGAERAALRALWQRSAINKIMQLEDARLVMLCSALC